MLIYTQCGNFTIFLSLWFYVKSIFGDSRSAKSAILTHLEALKFDFNRRSRIKMDKKIGYLWTKMWPTCQVLAIFGAINFFNLVNLSLPRVQKIICD